MSRVRFAGSLVAAGLLLAACGSGNGSGAGGSTSGGEADKSAAQILDDAAAALAAAGSFHIDADQTATGDSGLGHFTLTFDVAGSGTAQGTLTSSGATASFVVSGGKFYVRGADFFAKVAGSQAAALIGDRWVVTSANSADFAALESFADATQLARCLKVDHGTVVKGGTSTVGSQAAIVLVDKGDKPGTAPGKLYVAASGTAYPLKVEITGKATAGTSPGGAACGSNSSSSDSTGTLLFSNFGAHYSVAVPTDAVSLDTLMSGG